MLALGSRQPSLHNQDLDFQFNFKGKLNKSIPDKNMIYLLNLKELHPEHISALYNSSISSGILSLPSSSHPIKHVYIASRSINVVLKMLNCNFHRNNLGTLLMKGYPIYSIKNIVMSRSIRPKTALFQHSNASLLTPGNDRGVTFHSIDQSNQFHSRALRSIEHERFYDFHSKQFSCRQPFN